MNTLRLKPAMRYQLNYMFWASIIAFAIAIAVLILLTVLVGVTGFTDSVTVTEEVLVDGEWITINDDSIIVDAGPINFDIAIGVHNTSGVTFQVAGIFALMLFIIGIAGTREDLRFFVQHGLSRKTTFVSTLLTSIIIAVAYALVSEAIYLAFTHLTSFPISGLRISSAGFFGRFSLQTLTLFFAWQLGAVISLIYYRMNTVAKVIFSITAGATIIFVIPALIGFTVFSERSFLSVLVDFIATTHGTIILFLALGAICALGNYLLIRRAPIKEFPS